MFFLLFFVKNEAENTENSEFRQKNNRSGLYAPVISRLIVRTMAGFYFLESSAGSEEFPAISTVTTL